MSYSPKDVLVLVYDEPAVPASPLPHLEALRHGPYWHRVFHVNLARGSPPWLHRARLDALILHGALLNLRRGALWPVLAPQLDWVRHHSCLKIALPWDEYDHSELLDEWLYYWKVSVVVTNFDPRQRRALYPILHDRAEFVRAPAGCRDPDAAWPPLDRLPDLAQREVDIVCRAGHLPYWLGSHGQREQRLADVVRRRALQRGLRCDLATGPADDWFRHLTTARTVVGMEGGSSALDARGQLRAFIQDVLSRGPDLSFEEISLLLPAGWDDYRFFSLGTWNFGALYARAAQILVEGEYDHVLKPDKHYIPLKGDYSNLDEVLDKVHDTRLLQEMADAAYRDICLRHSHPGAELCGQIDAVIQRRQQPPAPLFRPTVPLRLATHRDPWAAARARLHRLARASWHVLPRPVRATLRAATGLVRGGR